MLSQNDLERERYRARLKWERDQRAFIIEAREEALREGRAEGRAQGREEGRTEGIKEGIREGIKKGVDKGRKEGSWIGRIRLSQDLLGLPVSSEEELSGLGLNVLEKQALASKNRFGS